MYAHVPPDDVRWVAAGTRGARWAVQVPHVIWHVLAAQVEALRVRHAGLAVTPRSLGSELVAVEEAQLARVRAREQAGRTVEGSRRPPRQ